MCLLPNVRHHFEFKMYVNQRNLSEYQSLNLAHNLFLKLLETLNLTYSRYFLSKSIPKYLVTKKNEESKLFSNS